MNQSEPGTDTVNTFASPLLRAGEREGSVALCKGIFAGFFMGLQKLKCTTSAVLARMRSLYSHSKDTHQPKLAGKRFFLLLQQSRGSISLEVKADRLSDQELLEPLCQCFPLSLNVRKESRGSTLEATEAASPTCYALFFQTEGTVTTPIPPSGGTDWPGSSLQTWSPISEQMTRGVDKRAVSWKEILEGK